jgi:hypothetical protein
VVVHPADEAFFFVFVVNGFGQVQRVAALVSGIFFECFRVSHLLGLQPVNVSNSDSLATALRQTRLLRDACDCWGSSPKHECDGGVRFLRVSLDVGDQFLVGLIHLCFSPYELMSTPCGVQAWSSYLLFVLIYLFCL